MADLWVEVLKFSDLFSSATVAAAALTSSSKSSLLESGVAAFSFLSSPSAST